MYLYSQTDRQTDLLISLLYGLYLDCGIFCLMQQQQKKLQNGKKREMSPIMLFNNNNNNTHIQTRVARATTTTTTRTQDRGVYRDDWLLLVVALAVFQRNKEKRMKCENTF